MTTACGLVLFSLTPVKVYDSSILKETLFYLSFLSPDTFAIEVPNVRAIPKRSHQPLTMTLQFLRSIHMMLKISSSALQGLNGIKNLLLKGC